MRKRDIYNYIYSLRDKEDRLVCYNDFIFSNRNLIDEDVANFLLDEIYFNQINSACCDFVNRMRNYSECTCGNLETVFKACIIKRLYELRKNIHFDSGDVKTSFPWGLFYDKEIFRKILCINPHLISGHSYTREYNYILNDLLTDDILGDVTLFKHVVLMMPNLLYRAKSNVKNNKDIALMYVSLYPFANDIFSDKIKENEDVLVARMLFRQDSIPSDYIGMIESVVSVIRESRYNITDKNIIEFKSLLNKEKERLACKVDINSDEELENWFYDHVRGYLGLSESDYFTLKNKNVKELKKTPY